MLSLHSPIHVRCGTFKDDVSSLTGFTPSSKIEKTLVALHEPESAKSKVTSQPLIDYQHHALSATAMHSQQACILG